MNLPFIEFFIFIEMLYVFTPIRLSVIRTLLKIYIFTDSVDGVSFYK